MSTLPRERGRFAPRAETPRRINRRYSHHGSVANPKGMPLSSVTMKALRAVYDRGIGWRVIAYRCRVSRTTLYRALCGGNVHASTRESIRRFAQEWRRAEDLSKHMRRWSPARRAAYERSRRAA